MRAEAETGVNAIFLASVAALESGWGTSYAAQTKNNLFGWYVGGELATFETSEDCVMAVARSLRDDYLTEGGKHYHGETVEAVAQDYSASPEWAQAVRGLMDYIGGGE